MRSESEQLAALLANALQGGLSAVEISAIALGWAAHVTFVREQTEEQWRARIENAPKVPYEPSYAELQRRRRVTGE